MDQNSLFRKCFFFSSPQNTVAATAAATRAAAHFLNKTFCQDVFSRNFIMSNSLLHLKNNIRRTLEELPQILKRSCSVVVGKTLHFSNYLQLPMHCCCCSSYFKALPLDCHNSKATTSICNIRPISLQARGYKTIYC